MSVFSRESLGFGPHSCGTGEMSPAKGLCDAPIAVAFGVSVLCAGWARAPGLHCTAGGKVPKPGSEAGGDRAQSTHPALMGAGHGVGPSTAPVSALLQWHIEGPKRVGQHSQGNPSNCSSVVSYTAVCQRASGLSCADRQRDRSMCEAPANTPAPSAAPSCAA